MMCASLVLGLHLATAHVRTDLNNVNPGGYLNCDGFVVGAYHNSVRRGTVYAGYSFQVLGVDVTVGAATGYSKMLRPFIVPSVKYGPVRLHFIPPSSGNNKGGVHLSYEIEF